MNERLLQIYSTYKSSGYHNSDIEMDFNWVRDKLNEDDFEELEKQVYTTMLENEEEIFVNCFKFAWGLSVSWITQIIMQVLEGTNKNMDKNWIIEIYKTILQTDEYNEEAMKIKIDLSWLEKKLERKEASRLEETIFDYAEECQAFMFERGFMCAWELFSRKNAPIKPMQIRWHYQK